jgi:hypothetical protein
MARRGRKPTGAQLVERLEGSTHAKGRLKVILETLSGSKTIPQACAELGIQESMFHKLRGQVLQTAVDRLEPRPAGRKPHLTSAEVQRIEELEAELLQTRIDLKAAEIQRELAVALPRLGRSRHRGETAAGSAPHGGLKPVSQLPDGVAAELPAEGPGKKTTHSRHVTRHRKQKRRRQHRHR